MTRIKLPYINEYVDRNGKLRRYVRRPGCPGVPLPGVPGSPEFMRIYEAAVSGSVPRPKARHEAGSLNAVAISYFVSIEFANLKPNSQAAYRKALGPVLARDGHRMIADMPPNQARAIVQEIGARAPGMANLTRSALRMLVNHAVGLRLRADNPFDHVPVYKLGTHHTWTEAELAIFEARWPLGTRERLAFDLLLWTGQRVGDVAKMRRSDIVNGSIRIAQEKTGAEVTIPIRPELSASLKAYPVRGLALIGDAAGRPIQAGRLSHFMAEAIDMAGLPPRCVAHGLRKAVLRRLAESGASTKQIAAISGHKSLEEIELYTKMADSEKLARAGMRRLGRNKKRT